MITTASPILTLTPGASLVEQDILAHAVQYGLDEVTVDYSNAGARWRRTLSLPVVEDAFAGESCGHVTLVSIDLAGRTAVYAVEVTQ